MTTEQIAKVCHETNQAYVRATGQNMAMGPWETCSEGHKHSLIAGVLFNLDNPQATPEMSHESWLKQKKEDGWKYGPLKDEEKKEHPCFLPYAELPVEQRVKDFLFKQTIESLRPFHNVNVSFDDIAEGTMKELTFGQKASGVTFNPGNNSEVTVLKNISAQFIDQCDVARKTTDNSDKKRYYSKAISAMEDAQMNAVKAATWQH